MVVTELFPSGVGGNRDPRDRPRPQRAELLSGIERENSKDAARVHGMREKQWACQALS